MLYIELRRRGGCKRALGRRAPITPPQGPNQRYSLDFASDTPIDGRRLNLCCDIAPMKLAVWRLFVFSNLKQPGECRGDEPGEHPAAQRKHTKCEMLPRI